MGDGIRLRHRRIKGETIHVWEVYNASKKYVERTQGDYDVWNLTEKTKIYVPYRNSAINGYTFDETTGIFTLERENMSEYTGVAAFSNSNTHSSSVWMVDTTSGRVMYADAYAFSPTSIHVHKRYYSELVITKLDARGEIVVSNDINAYPQNGYNNGYWYVYSHSYQK